MQRVGSSHIHYLGMSAPAGCGFHQKEFVDTWIRTVESSSLVVFMRGLRCMGDLSAQIGGLPVVIRSQLTLIDVCIKHARERSLPFLVMSANAIHEYALFSRSSTRRKSLKVNGMLLRDAFSVVLNGATEEYLARVGVPFIDTYWHQRSWFKLPDLDPYGGIAKDFDVRHHAVFSTIEAINSLLHYA